MYRRAFIKLLSILPGLSLFHKKKEIYFFIHPDASKLINQTKALDFYGSSYDNNDGTVTYWAGFKREN